ncbi:MAG: NADH-quinone oxidoreductase subunit NuoH [Alloprevotella sp.]|nr:NADH-quinone oxidoreductase subunit NuoH [Alloprevotella sp.]
MFDLQTWTTAIHTWLTGFIPEWTAILLESVVVALIIITLYAVFAIALIYLERKICAFFQCRIGPNRVGKWGLLQVFGDVFKMLQKEIIRMRKSDRFLHDLAPYLVVTASMLTFACLPWNKGGHIIDFNIGIFFMLAVSSIGVVGILLAGLGSNSKYPMIGAMRAGAQLISYEISIGLTMLTMVALTGTMQISEIVQQQADYGWNIVRGHLPALIAFLVYLIAGNAECNRGPFDLPEGESELTAGYHTEYSGMHFGYYYLAEYLNLFIAAGIASTIFLGGWAPLHIAGLDGFNHIMDLIPGFFWFVGKTFFVVFLLMWERWTFPRLRIDHILSLEWKYLMPISLINLLLMALVVVLGLGINLN